MSEDEFILVVNSSEMEYIRSSLRNESARLSKLGLHKLKSRVDKLRDKVSSMMIEQVIERLGGLATKSEVDGFIKSLEIKEVEDDN